MRRRDFLAATAAALAGSTIPGPLLAASESKRFQKALIGEPTAETFQQGKAVGFEGMETTEWRVTPEQAAQSRKLAESFGMPIHSVMFGWGKLNKGESAFAETVARMEQALRAAAAYGADAVLFVPCQIGGMPMPEAWEFDLRFDPRSGHLTQVVRGDNRPYAQYLEAHNQAVDASRRGIEKLIPTAEKTGVRIAVENVWNNLWVKPDIFTNFVASFQSPWVQAYFDIGNHVKYAPPEQWIRALGKLILKCHVKDFRLNPNGRGGEFCEIRDGSVNWPVVLAALDEVGYRGWMTIEGVGLPLREESRRLDLILAGK